jgi:hypothetical protein
VGSDPFRVLGLEPNATLGEARAAYRRLAELFHPDRLEGLREDVRAEGTQRMREATEAMRRIRDLYARPLVAPGHERPARPTAPGTSRDDPRPRGQPSGHRRARRPTARPEEPAGTPARADGPRRSLGSPPSDAATEATARFYHAQVRSLDGPDLQVNWGGRHAAATLAALRRAHTIDGPIRQVEWGSYEWVMDGAATRRLLVHVLEDREWHREPAEIVNVSAELRERRLPARRGEELCSTELGTVVELVDDQRWYRVVAEAY